LTTILLISCYGCETENSWSYFFQTEKKREIIDKNVPHWEYFSLF